ncbi:MAG: DUF3794 domain-containing protein [Ruminococcus sp.]|nr:DUF3794 domain-containing protein [Ruminococcus sp.]
MDYVLKSRSLTTSSNILDTVSQQPVDLDFTLPDYLADVETILKTDLDTKIYTRSLSAGQLRIDGASVVTVLYLDSDRKALRVCEQTLPFSATIPVSSECSDYVIFATAKPEYLNCRALSPRRLSVHGAFSLHTKITCKKPEDIFEETSDQTLQTKQTSCTSYELNDLSQEVFSVTEAVALNAKSMVESIVYSRVAAQVTECRNVAGKTVIKGEMTLHMLYITDNATGECDRFVYVFPFSHTMDSGTTDSNCSCVQLSVLSSEVILKSEPLSTEPVIALDCKLCATVSEYVAQQLNFVTDVYSTSCVVEPTLENITLCTDVHPLSAGVVSKSGVDLGDKTIQKIIDIFCDDTSATADLEDSSIRFEGQSNLSILGITDEGEITCIRRQVDFSHTENLTSEFNSIEDVEADVTSLSYRLGADNNMEVRLELRITSCLRSLVEARQVVSVNSVSDELSEDMCALTLYYADKGESVWEIARHFHASVESIIDENSLEEDTLPESRMLVITRA